MAKKALSPHNPRTSYTHVMLGMLYLGNERYKDAAAEFADAKTAGLARYLDYPLIDATERRFARANSEFAALGSSGVASADLDAFIPRIAAFADQSDFQSAEKILGTAQQQADKISTNASLRFQSIGLALSAVSGSTSESSALQNIAAALKQALQQAATSERPDLQVSALFTAYLAARAGDIGTASELVAAANQFGTLDQGSRLAKLQSVALAQIALEHGDSTAAIKILTPQLDGNELYLSHVVLQDAYSASHERKSAISEAQWLVKHRGRAYSEWSVPEAIPFAVAQSDIALLRTSELTSALGDSKDAQSGLSAFLLAWPNAHKNPQLAARIKRLQMGSASHR
jgi:hypothetical protein